MDLLKNITIIFICQLFFRAAIALPVSHNQQVDFTGAYLREISDFNMQDTSLVGGKAASLGEMTQNLGQLGVKVPSGFVLTTQGFLYFLEANNLIEPIKTLLSQTNDTPDSIKNTSNAITKLIMTAKFPYLLETEITAAYNAIAQESNIPNPLVAIRSSAVSEDSQESSFAGQHETFLYVQTIECVFAKTKECMASIFSERALLYRKQNNISLVDFGMAVIIQRMVACDTTCSGVIFTADPESGFQDVVVITSVYGAGESLVSGHITPDEFYVHKPTLIQGYRPIIKKQLGNKTDAYVHNKNAAGTIAIEIDPIKKNKFSLTDNDILALAHIGITIEKYYSGLYQKNISMDIEWAKDEHSDLFYVLQARPQTTHTRQQEATKYTYAIDEKIPKKILLEGSSIGQKIAMGNVCILSSLDDISQCREGDIVVTAMTDPCLMAVLKKAAAIITEQGGRTCHAAIVCRELGIPAIVGAQGATSLLKNNMQITVDCSSGAKGYIYEGKVPFQKKLRDIPNVLFPALLMVTISDPETAFTYADLPVHGIGLVRSEFIITKNIKAHPMAIAMFDALEDQELKQNIRQLSCSYNSPQDFFVQTLAQSIGSIAASFYPRPVRVRLTDFKSNEYRNLLGGNYFEPHEENPMLGLRGASRYSHPQYAPAFSLECKAIAYAREVMGFTNIDIVVPFVRTPQEAKESVKLLEKNGLTRGDRNLKIVLTVEVPSNILLFEDFEPYFDAFMIGSNDLTQLTLGIDRDSTTLAPLFNEKDNAVKKLIVEAIQKAHYHKKPIGIAGQATSDFFDMVQFALDSGIDFISLSPDSVIPMLNAYASAHK